jgi:DNA-binding ferritin-like protein
MKTRTIKHNKNTKHNIKNNTVKYNKSYNRFSNSIKTKIIEIFLGILNSVKIYHWKTYSFSQHKSTDELYSKLNENMDTFIEILLGKDENRFTIMNEKIDLYNFKNVKKFKQRIYNYRDFLIYLSKVLDSEKDTDLLSVRDEILGHINQFLYLMTFNK